MTSRPTSQPTSAFRVGASIDPAGFDGLIDIAIAPP